jgi:hypothetical protein
MELADEVTLKISYIGILEDKEQQRHYRDEHGNDDPGKRSKYAVVPDHEGAWIAHSV